MTIGAETADQHGLTGFYELGGFLGGDDWNFFHASIVSHVALRAKDAIQQSGIVQPDDQVAVSAQNRPLVQGTLVGDLPGVQAGPELGDGQAFDAVAAPGRARVKFVRI